MDTKIDTMAFGLAAQFDRPKSKDNRHRSKWRVRFDTGIDMLVPPELFEVMVFHLEEVDPTPPRDNRGGPDG